MATDYDHRYLEGIAHFNACDFFEAHEVWEDLWKDYSGDLRLFYKGLIHVAVCLHHFGNENIRGAKKLYHSSRGYLQPYGPVCEGLNIEQLLAQMEACCQEFLDSPEEFPKVTIDPEKIPEIHLQE